MADIKISELTRVASLNNGDLVEVSQENALSESGYVSLKATMTDLADKIANEIEYTTDLANFTDKTLTGAINEVKDNLSSLTAATLPYSTDPTEGSTKDKIDSKADKSGMFKVQQFNKTYSVAANSVTNFDNSFISVPSGYTIAATIAFSPNQDSIVVISCRPNDSGQWAFQLRNLSASDRNNQNFAIRLLFIKNELIS